MSHWFRITDLNVNSHKIQTVLDFDLWVVWSAVCLPQKCMKITISSKCSKRTIFTLALFSLQKLNHSENFIYNKKYWEKYWQICKLAPNKARNGKSDKLKISKNEVCYHNHDNIDSIDLKLVAFQSDCNTGDQFEVRCNSLLYGLWIYLHSLGYQLNRLWTFSPFLQKPYIRVLVNSGKWMDDIKTVLCVGVARER